MQKDSQKTKIGRLRNRQRSGKHKQVTKSHILWIWGQCGACYRSNTWTRSVSNGKFGNKIFTSLSFQQSCCSDSSRCEFEVPSQQPCLTAKAVWSCKTSQEPLVARLGVWPITAQAKKKRLTVTWSTRCKRCRRGLKTAAIVPEMSVML